MSNLRFDGRVAIVTGAGNGLGRNHALLLASLGAKVVVNDLGGGTRGESGESSRAADVVVNEIKALGGEAVADYNSVEHGDKIVKTALDAFGTVDIVVNNAGILRDVSFQKMSDADWDLVLKVHLTGSKSVTQAAWPIMREKGYGRVVMTTSAAGIYGNFGQANYCSAKLGIAGLANCLAEEGRSKGIFVNTIAPIAASRLTEGILPEALLEALTPEAVSPLVAWLCHEDCEETKGLFEVGAGYIAKLRWERTRGHSFPVGKAFSINDVAGRWSKIGDFTDAEHPTNTNDSIAPILHNISNPSLGGNEFIDLDAAATASVTLESSYDANDLALYALGVGAARDPLDASELNYVYELSNDFQALPTFGVMPQSGAMLAAAKEGTLSLPASNFGFDRLLHGEQYTEIKRPLPSNAKLTHTFKLKAAYDKAPNAVVVYSVSSKDESGEELIYNEMTAFVKGAGGWGGDRGPSTAVNVPPSREPDAVIEEKTDANQTLLYRLSGDWNPLHADPAFAQAFGFEKPILHGLCTFGYCGRHVIKAFCKNDGRYFKSIKVRFAKSVFPGDTLVTKMWKESDTRIIIETSVKERNEVVISNAAVELYSEIPSPKAKVKAVAAAAGPALTEPAILLAADVFGVVAAHIVANPDLVEKTKTSFQFNLKAPEESWFIDLKNGVGSAGKGTLEKPDVTMALEQKHLETVMTGTLAEVQKLFFGGEMKLTGNVMASNKLIVMQVIDKKLYEAARDARIGAGGGIAAVAVAETVPVVDEGATMADFFAAIGEFITAKPGLVGQVKTSFQFKYHNPDSDWFIDLKSANGAAGAGVIDKPDVTLEMDEEHAATVFGGKTADVQKLYFSGKMKVLGNVMASNKLAVLQEMDPKMVEQARSKRLASGAATAPVTAAGGKSREASAQLIFGKLTEQIAGGKLASTLNQVIQFNVREPDASWVIDFTAKPVKVSTGVSDKAAAVFGISDENLKALAQGKREVRELYQKGDLRVDGDVQLAHQLSFLNNLA
ncbi:3-hydroxyacyl-CoA dehydrogenase / 3a,7a,12a-trihydroxy-5b-cholest-24-enoyl-CoA hydratase [Collimonas sp. OK307]|uniref:SDR family NAD(P)-dependent oxidoreductase n=1 Tax=Collimonas sp. OK307 TaxID=1801620 RepID=UPI0008F45815|nr:SDR family NAD(P)-dependent oxidoreductase [Collimonas sp. OK307]SFI00449.1 3-hydroxyacyl-CoA dehydrogenase / 3a,7a,12a-trihydroxy-5b-cholest-24-enoyl-CoA hydratase [Collimonas sp. OK307]